MKKILSQLGFTMIELLVVIAVIGVLAVAVLSSINPIEQINKGRDTGHRSDAAQLINAVDRYYAIHEIYPWNDVTYNGTSSTPDVGSLTESQLADVLFPDDTTPGNCAGTPNGTGAFPGSFCKITTAALAPWLTALTATAEIKESFTQRLTSPKPGGELWLYKAATANATMYACFTPSSQAFQKEALDACRDHYANLPLGACPQAADEAGYATIVAYDDELICLP
ncbi:MAG: hypothetical protein UY10_C0029G0005 [Microgenomates group bacterium GW2011_GWA2_47_8]|nr:MAG: hypothetical protein UY10_C0029G0005 [Microgenomates group bacterium GW2011_GWA2_47_8]